MDGKDIQIYQIDKNQSVLNIIKPSISLLVTPAEWKHERSIF